MERRQVEEFELGNSCSKFCIFDETCGVFFFIDFCFKYSAKMNIQFRRGDYNDLNGLKRLALKSWGQYQTMLSPENWKALNESLNDHKTYTDLLENAECFICTNNQKGIIGMAFLVPSGNPTEIYDKDWSYIRFVTVDPDFGGKGIGKQLTKLCIDLAKSNNEKFIALHTSELMNNARHIYESFGFSVLKEIDQRLGKRYWLYKLDL